jgi:hypothetical protein
VRGEVESSQVGTADTTGLGTFSRVRLGMRAQAASWLTFDVQLQDSRTLSGPADLFGDFPENRADVQYAYADVGSDGSGWKLRVGRQPLAFGDERLVGADAWWDNRGQRFDGVRATWKSPHWQWDAFTATATEILPRGLDRFTGPQRLAGVYGAWSHGSTALEPYVFWNQATDEDSRLWTPGVRLASGLTRGWDVIAEAAAQGGSAGGVPVRAWAVSGEIGYRPGRSDKSPRLALSYSHGSGDDNPRDRRIGTFNDLHPAGYNACGFFEPFSWRNIRDLRVSAEWSGGGPWQIRSEFHAYWLATLHDGVYVDQGPWVAYDPAAPSSHLGSRALVMVRRGWGDHFEAAAGYARFFAADYMKKGAIQANTAFLSWNVRL